MQIEIRIRKHIDIEMFEFLNLSF